MKNLLRLHSYARISETDQRQPFLTDERLVQSPTMPTIENVVRFQPQQSARIASPPVSQQMLLRQYSSSNQNGVDDLNGGVAVPGYARVQQRATGGAAHTEELNLQLQTMARNSDLSEGGNVLPSQFRTRTFGSDINPSVGDISDRESELDIRQMENSVSPLRNGSSVSPPSRSNSRQGGGESSFAAKVAVHSPETDF